MDDKPKSIWKTSWAGWRGLLLGWSILMAVLLACFFVFLMAAGTPVAQSGEEIRLFGAFGIVVTLIFLLATFGRWLCCWRNFKRFLFGCACFATLIALAYVEENWRGKHDWEKFKREWEAKGEHFDFASVVPPPVPDEQNFALTPVIASSYETYFDKSGHEVRPRNTNVVDRLSMITWRDNPWAQAQIPKSDNPDWLASKKTDLKAWQDFFRSKPPTNSLKTGSFATAPQPQSPADDVLLALSKYDSAIEEIRVASELPYSRFPLTYGNGDPAAILLPHLAALKSCAQALGLRSLAELQNRQSEKTLDDVKLQLRLADSIRAEQILISQFVRIAILKNALQPVWEGLAEHNWTEPQLVALDHNLKTLNFIADYKSVMRGVLGFQGGIIEFLQRQPEQFMNLSTDNYSGQASSFPVRIMWQLIPAGFFYQNRLNCAHIMVDFYIPLADVDQRTISPTLAHRADAAVGAATQHRNPYNIFGGMLHTAFGSAGGKFAQAQTSVDLARVAIALERYRLAHGEFPQSLGALTPHFMEKIPHDVINGQPLQYRRTDDGQFVLYSVGWNEKDDGGKVIFKKNSENVEISQGDWVWRYPAK